MRLKFFHFFILWGWLLFCEVPAFAQTQEAPVQDPILIQAQEAMDEAEYARALNWIEKGLKRQDLSTHHLLQLYWLEGVCFISLNQQNNALTSFRKLLAIAPDYQADPLTPPKIMRVFKSAQQSPVSDLAQRVQLRPRTVPLEPQAAQQSVNMRLIVDGSNNATTIQRVVIYVRPRGESAFSNIDAVPTDPNKETFAATIPGFLLKAEPDDYEMEYYWEILGQESIILAKAGSAEAPQNFTVLAGKATADNKDALSNNAEATDNASVIYVAIGISVVVVAGVVTAIYLLQPQSASATVTVTCQNDSCFP